VAIHKLTDKAVQNLKPRDDGKGYRVHDGGGLALWVAPTGIKSWQLRYRLDGKEQTATLGKLANLPLAQARKKAADLRGVAAEGTHLTQHKHEQRLVKKRQKAETFEAMADAWMAHRGRRKEWTEDYRLQVDRIVKRDLAALLPLPVTRITAAIADGVLEDIGQRAPHMEEKAARFLQAILDHAVRKGAISGNPLPRRRDVKLVRRNFPAVTDPKRVGEILRAARGADPCKGIARAHVLVAFTAQRIAEVVGAAWSEIDVDKATWTIPRSRMKLKDPKRGPHVVPLPPELVAEIKRWRVIDAKDARLVCPAPRDGEKPITPEGVEKFYREVLKLVGEHSPHSWRTTFKTWCADAGKPRDVSEAQIDHAIGDKTETAYDRAKRLELRRELMRWYERELITVRDGAEVVALRKR
jgi:integrase